MKKSKKDGKKKSSSGGNSNKSRGNSRNETAVSDQKRDDVALIARRAAENSSKNGSMSTNTPLPPSVSLGATRLEVGLDLGGSLTKVCFFEPYDAPESGKKLASFISGATTYGATGVRDPRLSFESKRLGGRFHFIYFQTSRTQGAIDMMKSIALAGSDSRVGGTYEVHATGGGAIKFASLVEQELGIRLIAEDELETVVNGIVFTLLEQPNTVYSVEPEGTSENSAPTDLRIPRSINLDDIFPLLVVNIGSGVSIIKVDDPNSMRRISGTAVGGGTFYGLCKLLTRCETFEEAMDMADRGDSRMVNMLVSDIYGGSYDRVGLPGSITASFFGKAASATSRARPASSGSHEDVILARRERSDPLWVRSLRATAPGHIPASVLLGVLVCDRYGLLSGILLLVGSVFATLLVLFALHVRRQRRHRRPPVPSSFTPGNKQIPQEDIVFQDEDIARALVTMVAQNITQIAFLNAKLHHTKRIIFTGNFLRHNPIALRTLTTNLRLFSGGEVEALFMEHEGFFGAIGAFLSSEQAKGKLQTQTVDGVSMPRTSSFHGPEEGDDVFHLSSPKSEPRKGAKDSKFAEKATTSSSTTAPEPDVGTSSRSMIDVMADLRLT
jgi:type II pantothenate kinase